MFVRSNVPVSSLHLLTRSGFQMKPVFLCSASDVFPLKNLSVYSGVWTNCVVSALTSHGWTTCNKKNPIQFFFSSVSLLYFCYWAVSFGFLYGFWDMSHYALKLLFLDQLLPFHNFTNQLTVKENGYSECSSKLTFMNAIARYNRDSIYIATKQKNKFCSNEKKNMLLKHRMDFRFFSLSYNNVLR